jgi:glycerol-3-phosphate dehydrogenase
MSSSVSLPFELARQWEARRMTEPESTDVVIVGGGFGGSALGLVLARRGIRVSIL